jgi:hypothetical protein
VPRITFNKSEASSLLRELAKNAHPENVDPIWKAQVEELSNLCEVGSRTHIAFLGTAMLAKCLNDSVDLYAIKPEHASPSANSFSARTLCHSVLVPLAAELGIHIGVTGREPLNNQPYFRMTKLGDGTPVHANGQAAFDYMLTLVDQINALKSKASARDALRAFIAVRKTYVPKYSVTENPLSVRPDGLGRLISRFVRDNSENGRRAQAVVAGLLDVFAGPDRVLAGRINDPSRHFPGDVCVFSSDDHTSCEKSFEVRDKPVTAEDVQIFANQCLLKGVRDSAVVMVSDKQPKLDEQKLAIWASGLGIGLTLFHGWEEFVNQVLFWTTTPKPEAARESIRTIEDRLISIEVAPASIALWQTLAIEEES